MSEEITNTLWAEDEDALLIEYQDKFGVCKSRSLNIFVVFSCFVLIDLHVDRIQLGCN